jgi:hypothetical protein
MEGEFSALLDSQGNKDLIYPLEFDQLQEPYNLYQY